MKTKRLYSRLLVASEFSERQARELFHIFERHYTHVTWPQFERDLAEKDFVIVLLDAESDEPRGFSTQKIVRANVAGEDICAIFSGDTVIDRAYWGEQELVRRWCQFAGQVLASCCGERLYWFLISKGYRTYLFQALFFREFYPRYDRGTPAREQQIMDALAEARFGSCYDPASGLIEFENSHGQLTSELAEIPAARREHPHVKYFVDRNPDHARGVELVCLAEINPPNMRSFAADWVRRGEQMGPLPAAAGPAYA